MTAIDEAVEFAKKQSKAIVESGEEHQPIMLALTPQGGAVIHLVEINKDEFKENVGMLLRQLSAYAYVFINEAWVAKLDKDSSLLPRLMSGEISVSELPLDDRTEILTIIAAENRKSYHCWFAKIRYTPDDKRYLGEWEEMEGDSGGRLILKEW